MSDQSSPEILLPNEVYSPHSDEVVFYERPRHRYWLNLLLLFATFCTTLVIGARLQVNFDGGRPAFPLDESFLPPFAWALNGHYLLLGLPFSLTLLGILLAHELGHYLCCLKYRVDATPPFFIPFPSLIGTLGAFIRIRSPLRSRKVLFDIGIAGPIAGFLVALPVLLFSLGKSHVAPLPEIPRIDFGFPLIFLLVRKLLVAFGHGGAISNVPTGSIYLHPVAIAAWVGMFATSLNLLPGGQLDGGHLVFAVSPRLHKAISRLTIVALIPLALFYWPGWILWAVMLRVTGRHPAVAEWPGLGAGRRWLALGALLMLVLTFTYIPISSDGSQSLIEVIRSFAGAWHGK